jgi:hypothetical protein
MQLFQKALVVKRQIAYIIDPRITKKFPIYPAFLIESLSDKYPLK